MKEASIEGTVEEVLHRVQTVLDPFYIRVDEESLIKTTAEIQEDDYPIQFNKFGPYCPVTLVLENWLVFGKDDF